jgi:hypothetical protein
MPNRSPIFIEPLDWYGAGDPPDTHRDVMVMVVSRIGAPFDRRGYFSGGQWVIYGKEADGWKVVAWAERPTGPPTRPPAGAGRTT